MLRKRAVKRSRLCLCGLMLLYPVMGERVTQRVIPEILNVVVLPVGPYAPVAIREMTREVTSIMKGSGLKFKWNIGLGQQVFDEPLAVVKLLGTCSMDMPGIATKPGPLGQTHVVDGDVLPFSELACDNIRRAIESAMRGEDRARRDTLLGRAMGRVLAHELFHIVAATKKHTSAGISQPALSGAELISDRLEFDSASVELMQEQLHGGR